nr:MAG TPA: hypothetical protein [Caudoviricetes sp.]
MHFWIYIALISPPNPCRLLLNKRICDDICVHRFSSGSFRIYF